MRVAIHHEKLIGMVRHIVEPAQISQHDLDRDIRAHLHHVEVHDRADRVFRVGHRRAELLALLHRQRLEDVLDDLPRQVRREIGDLVGVELLGRGDELVFVHARDERLAHGIGDFEQDLAVALGFHEIPYDEPLIQRERFEDVSDIGWMQPIELGLKRFQVARAQRVFHALACWRLVAREEILLQLQTAHELRHLLQQLLSGVGCFCALFHVPRSGDTVPRRRSRGSRGAFAPARAVL